MATHTQRAVPGVATPWTTAPVAMTLPTPRAITPTASSGIGTVTGLRAPWSWHEAQGPVAFSTGGGGGRGHVALPEMQVGRPRSGVGWAGAGGGSRRGSKSREAGAAEENEQPPSAQPGAPAAQPFAPAAQRLWATYSRSGPALGAAPVWGQLGPGGATGMGGIEPTPPMAALPVGSPPRPLLPSGAAARKLPMHRRAVGHASARQFMPTALKRGLLGGEE